MQLEYFERLGTEAKSLADEVEQASGVEVCIRENLALAGRGPGGAGILTCDISARSIEISTPSPDYFPDGAVIHELLHAKRMLIENVPRLSGSGVSNDWGPEFESALTHLDNAIEHLVIVPDELSRTPARREHWEAVMKRTWEVDLPALSGQPQVKIWAFVHWAFLQHVLPDSSSVSPARELLEARGWAEEAGQFVLELTPLLQSKPELAMYCFRKFDLPVEWTALEYFDCRDGSSHLVELSDLPSNCSGVD
ncbi:hypothetical protein [Paucibacter soli]|uniref:hypothetical protein n=1 Tax=Paucibacter soli TaxID=3133433 RepID=UPI0030978F06